MTYAITAVGHRSNSREEPERWARRRELTRERFARAEADLLGRSELLRDIALDHLDVAESVARRFASAEADDLRQVGYLGLIKACDRFDSKKGDDFVSFAVPTITGEIKRYLRDTGWVIRPPRSVQELRARVIASLETITQRLGRTPTNAELALHLGVPRREIDEAISARDSMHPVSLDTPSLTAEGLTLADSVSVHDESFERAERVAALEPVIAALCERDRRIIYLRFFQENSQQEIATQLGVTQMQVSRLLAKILHTMRAAIGGDFEASPLRNRADFA